jgi:uncharacterized protein YggE
MKKFFIPMLFFLTINIAAAAEANYLTVSGTAEIKVKPNRLTFTIGIDKRAENLSLVKNDLEQTMKNVIAFCKKNGVDEKYLQTSHVSITPHYVEKYDTDRNQIPQYFTYYHIFQSLTVTLEDITKYEKLIYPLLEMGINRVESVDFSSSELRKYRDEARLAAIKAAQEKAKLLSGAAGIALGKPVTLSESQNSYTPYRATASQNVSFDTGGDMVGELSGSMAAGMISINVTVNITYETK